MMMIYYDIIIIILLMIIGWLACISLINSECGLTAISLVFLFALIILVGVVLNMPNTEEYENGYSDYPNADIYNKTEHLPKEYKIICYRRGFQQAEYDNLQTLIKSEINKTPYVED